MEKFATLLGREFSMVTEFGFKVPFTKFEKEDLKQWTMKGSGAKAGKGKKGGKGGKRGRRFKVNKHKEELRMVECDLIEWVLIDEAEEDEQEVHEVEEDYIAVAEDKEDKNIENDVEEGEEDGKEAED